MAVLAIHITSNSIETALFRIQKSGEPEVINSQSLTHREGFKKYVQDAHKILKENKEKITKILCIIGGSYSSSETRILTYNDKSPFLVDKNLINQFVEDNTSKGKEKDIEKEVIHTKVNGYDTNMPLGKEATLIELTVFHSTASSEIKEDMKEQFQSLSSNIVFHTFPYVAYRAFGASRHTTAPYLLIEVEKSISTFSLIKENSFLETTSFDKGSDFVLNTLMTEINVDKNVALSLLKMKNENTISVEMQEKVSQALGKAEKLWQQETFKALALLSQGLPIPQEMYVMAPDFWRNFFVKALENNDYNQFSYGNGVFTPTITESTYTDCIKLFIKNFLL